MNRPTRDHVHGADMPTSGVLCLVPGPHGGGDHDGGGQQRPGVVHRGGGQYRPQLEHSEWTAAQGREMRLELN